MDVHPTAVVSPNARMGAGNHIGPYVVIEDDVTIGDDNRFESHAVIKRGSRIGNGNVFHHHATIGDVPQDLKFRETASFVRIGDGNVFREAVTVHRGSRDQASTTIGDKCLLMVYSHVGHDCELGESVILTNNVALGGEVVVEDRAFISYGVGVHQFTRVGRIAMIGALTKITQSVLPFFITDGTPARLRGVNRVGLERAGYTDEDVLALKEAYRILLRSGLGLQAAIKEIGTLGTACTNHLADFLAAGSKRGFHRRLQDQNEEGSSD
jgi:UDP-N-acetylglucosamine acyltransferase